MRDVEIIRIELAALDKSFKVQDFDARRTEHAKPLLAQLAKNPVHMHARQATNLRNIRRSQPKRKAVAIAQPHCREAGIGLAQKMRHAPDAIEATEPKEPGAVNRCVD